MSDAASLERLQQLWNKTVDEVKSGDVNLPLWEALESTVPLTFEDPVLVLGMRSEDYHRSGHLNNPANAHAIRSILNRLTGRKVEFQVIEGTELRHWELEKQRRADKEAAARRTVDRAKAEDAGGLTNWDDIGIALQHKFQDTKDRNMPWVQAQYMLEAFELILELELKQRQEASADQHMIDRGVARMLQKIAGQLENLHIAVLGLEYHRFKKERGV